MRASSFEAAAGSRRGAAAEVLGLADRLTTLATVRSPLKRLLRNMFLRVVGALPFATSHARIARRLLAHLEPAVRGKVSAPCSAYFGADQEHRVTAMRQAFGLVRTEHGFARNCTG